MAARGHFVFPIDDKNYRVLVIWDLNGYGEYEFDRCICDKVMACTSVGVRRAAAAETAETAESAETAAAAAAQPKP